MFQQDEHALVYLENIPRGTICLLPHFPQTQVTVIHILECLQNESRSTVGKLANKSELFKGWTAALFFD